MADLHGARGGSGGIEAQGDLLTDQGGIDLVRLQGCRR
jgi:hypothetical protein